MKKHCISYPTKSLIFCKLLPFFQNKERIADTVNVRLSAAALNKGIRFLGAALIQLRRLIHCGAYFKDC